MISPFIFVKRSLLKTPSLFSNQAVDFFNFRFCGEVYHGHGQSGRGQIHYGHVERSVSINRSPHGTSKNKQINKQESLNWNLAFAMHLILH